jgi:uncharacterized protein YecT (DUF1311 family)
MNNAKVMQKAILTLSLALVFPAVAQQAADSDCDDPQNQAEMGNCAYFKMQAADADLNREWESLRSRLKQAEDDLSYEGWFDAALEGQRGWLAYRDGQCTAEGYEAHRGTMEMMLVAYCKTRLTRDRIRELEELNDSGGLGNTFPAVGKLTVETLEAFHRNGTLYRFPRIAGDSPAATRINTYLQTLVLDQIPGHERGGPFARVWPEKDSSHGLVGLDYTLSFEQPGILKVEIFREFYGANFTETIDTYHFDTHTGQLITLRHLLTPEGLVQVDAEIRETRLQQIDNFLAGNDLNGARLRNDPLEAEEQKVLYQECRSSIEMEHPVLGDAFRIGRHGYELAREPCGPRVQWALLDLDLTARHSFVPQQELLSNYGRCLLTERRASCRRGEGGPAPGVYLGRVVDSEPITLVVEAVNREGVPTGWYFHDERGERIAFDASLDGDGNLVLIDGSSPPATFRLRSTATGGLTGNWTREGATSRKVTLR